VLAKSPFAGIGDLKCDGAGMAEEGGSPNIPLPLTCPWALSWGRTCTELCSCWGCSRTPKAPMPALLLCVTMSRKAQEASALPAPSCHCCAPSPALQAGGNLGTWAGPPSLVLLAARPAEEGGPEQGSAWSWVPGPPAHGHLTV
jgi:hypothetical protein